MGGDGAFFPAKNPYDEQINIFLNTKNHRIISYTLFSPGERHFIKINRLCTDSFFTVPNPINYGSLIQLYIYNAEHPNGYLISVTESEIAITSYLEQYW